MTFHGGHENIRVRFRRCLGNALSGRGWWWRGRGSLPVISIISTLSVTCSTTYPSSRIQIIWRNKRYVCVCVYMYVSRSHIAINKTE